MTVYTPLATLEAHYKLTTLQLYKLLKTLNIEAKQTLSSCYLSELQIQLLEEWIENSVYSRLSLGEFIQALGQEETTYLYQCSNCDHLLLSSSLHKEGEPLLHACTRTLARKEKHAGHYLLIAAGPHEEMGELAHLIARGDWNDSRKLKLAS